MNSPVGAPAIALAAYSARSLVACARDSGYRAIALDAFGDQDTCALAEDWLAIGGPGPAIDPDRFLAALEVLRGRGVCGLVTGSGFEAHASLLETAMRVLPLIGNAPEVVRRVRAPELFFPVLAELGIDHPDSRCDPPAEAAGWLVKDAHACGGWHIARVADAPASPARRGPGVYYQREIDGEARSALFLADGDEACILGVARQIVRPLGQRPFVYRGGVGPVPLSPTMMQSLECAVSAMTASFGLRGLNGVDFIVGADGCLQVLELNPRPTAGMNLFHDSVAGGLLRAHAEACAGRLIPPDARPMPVRGFETVFARNPDVVGAGLARALLGRGWVCDVPPAGRRHARGDPVCTVVAQGESVEMVMRTLITRRRAVIDALGSGARRESSDGVFPGGAHEC